MVAEACLAANSRLIQLWLCRYPPGKEPPEMAEDFDTLGYYSPSAAQDMRSFGLLMLEMLGSTFTPEHREAMNAWRKHGDDSRTRAFARSLLGGEDYGGQVPVCTFEPVNVCSSSFRLCVLLVAHADCHHRCRRHDDLHQLQACFLSFYDCARCIHKQCTSIQFCAKLYCGDANEVSTCS